MSTGENAPAKDLCKGKADLELSELSLPQQVREKFWQEPRKRVRSGPRRCREAKPEGEREAEKVAAKAEVGFEFG